MDEFSGNVTYVSSSDEEGIIPAWEEEVEALSSSQAEVVPTSGIHTKLSQSSRLTYFTLSDKNTGLEGGAIAQVDIIDLRLSRPRHFSLSPSKNRT